MVAFWGLACSHNVCRLNVTVLLARPARSPLRHSHPMKMGKARFGFWGIWNQREHTHSFCPSQRQIRPGSSGLGNPGLESLALHSSFPLPNIHPLHQPDVRPQQPLGTPGSAVTWGSLEALSHGSGGPGPLPDPARGG